MLEKAPMKIHLKFLHRLYHWTLKWSAHPRASWALFGIAFIESSFFLIPPDVLLIPMTLAKPRRWAWYGFLTMIGSVFGGIAGYFIGWGLWESIGEAIVRFYHFEEEIAALANRYETYAFWTVFAAALTPIPYKIITISAGLFRISLVTMIVASFIGRGMRFFIVAALVGIFGEPIKRIIEHYFDLLAFLFVALLIIGFLVLPAIL